MSDQSFIILVAFDSSLVLPISSKEGKGKPTIFCAVLIDFLSSAEHPAYHTVKVHQDALYSGTVEEHQQLLRQLVRDESSQEFEVLNPLQSPH